MRICLLKSFPDEYRRSMHLYGESLLKALNLVKGEEDQVSSYFPKFICVKPAPLRYVSQYAGYPAGAFFHQGDINHVLDHSYAHLTHTLKQSRTVVTFHDAVWLKVKDGVFGDGKREKLRWIQRFNLSGLKKAVRITCDSEAGKRSLLEYLNYPEEKIKVIPLGIHEIFGKHAEVRPIKGIPEGNYILHVGHTGPYKNIPGLFRVLQLLKNKNIKLLKVGTDFSEEQKRLACELGVSEHILHLGKVPQEQLPSVYRAAKVLVMPSFDEGFGFPVLEAMTQNLPVLTSNRGSLPELVRDAGIMLDAEDYQGMASQAVKIIEDKEFSRALTQKGQERARFYSWENAARQMMEVYRGILEKRS